MDREHNNQKFIKHLKSDGLFYALWRAIKYLVFLLKKLLYTDKKGNLASQIVKKDLLTTNILVHEDLKVIYSNCGISIFWKEKEITVFPGLNLAINTLGIWTDSSKAKWQTLLQGRDFFNFKVVFRDLPLSQLWYVRISNNNEIIWRIRVQVEEWLHIDEFRLLALVSPCYKTWVSDYVYADFPRLDDYWHDIYLKNQEVSLVGARFSRGDNYLPSFTIESHVGGLLPLVQNPSLSNHSHIIGVRIKDVKNNNNFEPGIYPLFSSKVNIIENENILDSKIEVMRQNYLVNITGKGKDKKDARK